MPVRAFHCPQCDGEVGFDEALRHLTTREVHPQPTFPPALIVALMGDGPDPRRQGVHFTPSMAGGCMREEVLQRVKSGVLDPRRVWAMEQGSFWHEVMSRYPGPGAEGERLEPETWMGMAGVVALVTSGNNVEPFKVEGRAFRRNEGVWEFEIWPGIWTSWITDWRRLDHSEIIDYKIRMCPPGRRDSSTGDISYAKGGDYALNQGYVMQMNIYARGEMKLYGLVQMPRMTLWTCTAGMQWAAGDDGWPPSGLQPWEAREVPVMEEGELETLVRADYDRFRQGMEGYAIQGDEAIKPMPLQGLAMYGGRKCFKYCSYKEECDRIGGQVKWEL